MSLAIDKRVRHVLRIRLCPSGKRHSSKIVLSKASIGAGEEVVSMANAFDITKAKDTEVAAL
jgi:hypothetical protein